jgi:hypothetical protein
VNVVLRNFVAVINARITFYIKVKFLMFVCNGLATAFAMIVFSSNSVDVNIFSNFHIFVEHKSERYSHYSSLSHGLESKCVMNLTSKYRVFNFTDLTFSFFHG